MPLFPSCPRGGQTDVGQMTGLAYHLWASRSHAISTPLQAMKEATHAPSDLSLINRESHMSIMDFYVRRS